MTRSLTEKFKLAGGLLLTPVAAAGSGLIFAGLGAFASITAPVMAVGGGLTAAFNLLSENYDRAKSFGSLALASAGMVALSAGTSYLTKMDYIQSSMAISAAFGGLYSAYGYGKAVLGGYAEKVRDALDDPSLAP